MFQCECGDKSWTLEKKGRPGDPLMKRPEEMLAKATQCEEKANKARDPFLASTLRTLAYEWRDMAAQWYELEKEAKYRVTRQHLKP